MLAKRLTKCFLLFAVFFLAACGSHLYHIVKQGETLYSISWKHGHDYRKIAHWNGVKSPYVIKEGQRLVLVAPQGRNDWKKPHKHNKGARSTLQKEVLKGSVSNSDKHDGRVVRKDKNRSNKTRQKKRNVGKNKTLTWQWPTRGGKLLQVFDANDPGKSGLDIGGNDGQSVFSVSSGQVVYSGGGLPRYGKLIIVKHNDVFLSAYAHNRDLLVKEGDWVKLGQVIARMGNSGTSKVKLHFEIRRNGRAINPLRVLPKRMP